MIGNAMSELKKPHHAAKKRINHKPILILFTPAAVCFKSLVEYSHTDIISFHLLTLSPSLLKLLWVSLLSLVTFIVLKVAYFSN